jgi:hypothetical protein
VSARSTDPLDAMAEIIAERVLTKLLGRGIVNVATPKIYTTHKSGPHIPGKSRRWMKDHVQAMPGARKVGRDWEIDVADYESWAKAADHQAVTKTGAPRATNDRRPRTRSRRSRPRRRPRGCARSRRRP